MQDRGSAAPGSYPSSKSPTGKPTERAEGQGQFDYLRRLASQTRELEKEIREAGDRGIRAIGVLGSDPYDKLLILQALRPEFPDAIFFTTDLDARLLQREQQSVTRSLIVASTHGLRLRKELQKDVPPFRDNYQTSEFLAAQFAAFTSVNGRSDLDQKLETWLDPSKVQLFQIGRTLPVRLQASVPNGDSNCAAESLLVCAGLQPPAAPLYPALPFPSGRYFGVTLLVAILFAALGGYVLDVPKWLRRRHDDQTVRSKSIERLAQRCGWGLLCLVAAALLCYWWSQGLANFLTRNGQGEPLFMLEGISVWPTILLRVASIFISIGLLRHCARKLDRNAKELRIDFDLAQDYEREWRRDLEAFFAKRGRIAWLRDMLAYFLPSWRDTLPRKYYLGSNDKSEAVEIRAFWLKFVDVGQSGGRYVRTGVLVLLVLGLLVILVGILGPLEMPPARGSFVQSIHQAAVFLDILAMLALLFFIADAALMTCSLGWGMHQIRNRLRDKKIWPSATLKAHQLRFNLGEFDYVSRWLDLDYFARRTASFNNLIYYPFVVIALGIAARSPIFFPFSLNMPILIIQLLSMGVVLGCAILLPWVAKRVRDATQRKLTEELIRLKGSNASGVVQLEALIAYIGALRRGAFTPFSQQSVVRALLLPIGSYGGMALFEYLLRANV